MMQLDSGFSGVFFVRVMQGSNESHHDEYKEKLI